MNRDCDSRPELRVVLCSLAHRLLRPPPRSPRPRPPPRGGRSSGSALNLHSSINQPILHTLYRQTVKLRKIFIIFSASKTHLLKLLPVTLSLVVLTHLIFFSTFTGSSLINALNSNLPPWRTTFSTPLNMLIYVLCLIITLPHVLCILPTFCILLVPRVRTTFASRGFSIAAPTVWNSLPSSIHSSTYVELFVASLNSLSPAGLLLPLATGPYASDSATGWHCALQLFYLLTYLMPHEQYRSMNLNNIILIEHLQSVMVPQFHRH